MMQGKSTVETQQEQGKAEGDGGIDPALAVPLHRALTGDPPRAFPIAPGWSQPRQWAAELRRVSARKGWKEWMASWRLTAAAERSVPTLSLIRALVGQEAFGSCSNLMAALDLYRPVVPGPHIFGKPQRGPSPAPLRHGLLHAFGLGTFVASNRPTFEPPIKRILANELDRRLNIAESVCFVAVAVIPGRVAHVAWLAEVLNSIQGTSDWLLSSGRTPQQVIHSLLRLGLLVPADAGPPIADVPADRITQAVEDLFAPGSPRSLVRLNPWLNLTEPVLLPEWFRHIEAAIGDAVAQCSSRLSNRELDAATAQPDAIEPLLLASQSVMVEYALRKQRADSEAAANPKPTPPVSDDAEADSPAGMLGIAAAQLLYGCTEGAEWLGGAERCVKFLERELGSVENARLLVPSPYAGPILFRWANSLAELGRDEEAVRPLAIAREIARRAGNRPRNIAVCDEALAGISSRIGKPKAAIAIMSRLARQLRDGAEPDEAAAGRWDLLRSLVLYRLDRDDEAREIWKALIKAESASESSRASAAIACLHMGRSLLADSQAADGKAMLERGLSLSEGLTGEMAISREVFLRPLAGALLELELTEQALATFDDALTAHASSPESTEGEKLEYRCVRAAFVAATGDTEQAQADFLAGFDQLLALKPVPGPLVSAAVGQFVGFLVRRGMQSQAQDAVITALDLLSDRQVTMAEGESPEMLRLAVTHQQAFIDQSSGDTDGAIRLWKQISKRLERLGPRYHPDRLAVERFLADAENAPTSPDDDGGSEFDPDGDRDGGLM